MSPTSHSRPDLIFERLFEGNPIIAPTDNWWEAGVTFNTAAVFLENTPEHASRIQGLIGDKAADYPDGVVVLHYRARPKEDPGFPWTRSFVGLSVHAPDLSLIKRWSDPVVSPGAAGEFDELGVEDPRVTYLEGRFWMVYCGVSPLDEADGHGAWRGLVSVAVSDDLIHWEKLGPIKGTGEPEFAPTEDGVTPINNKDGVLFPERHNGKIYLLHRPMVGKNVNWHVALASAESMDGPFRNLGTVHDAVDFPEFEASWPGAGSTPIAVGPGQWLSIEHTGNTYPNRQRKYVLDAFLYDFSLLKEDDAQSLVAARVDDIMRPETYFEVHGPYADSVANVVFACGAYVHDGWLYVPYGGGDTYILGARCRLDELMSLLEAARANP